jgi:PAS domain S-box-containing protein
MHLQYTSSVLLVTAATVATLLTVFAWRRRHAPGTVPFMLLMLSVALWSLAYAFELGTPNLETKVLWAKIKYLGVVSVPAAWLFFVLMYTKRERWLALSKMAPLAIVPFITLFLVWTNNLHGLIWSSFGPDGTSLFPTPVLAHGAWFWVHTIYSHLLLLLAGILLLEALVRSSHLYRHQTGGLLIGVLAPWAGNILHVIGLTPLSNMDLTPFAFTLSGFALAWSVFGFGLLSIVSKAREEVIESMSDVVIVINALKHIVDLNPAAQRAIGVTASEAIGQPAAKVLANWPNLLAHNQDITETEAHSEIALGDKQKRRYFDLSISPLHDQHNLLTGRLIVLRDITERKQAEEVLQKAHDELERQVEARTAELLMANEYLKREMKDRMSVQEELRESLTLIGRAKWEWESTADSLPQLICLMDSQGHILRANRTMERWNLAQVVNVKGQKIHELFHPRCTDPNCYLRNFWPQAWGELACGRSTELEVEDRAMERHLLIQVQPILAKAHREGEETDSYAVVVLNDITERKRAEREIAALEEQLRRAQKMEAIGRLAGGIAHDFNNLLTPITGYSQLAMRTLSPSDPMRSDLQEIQKSADRAANLIRQMMSFSRRQPVKPQVININNVLLDLDKMLRRLIGEHIELVTLPAPDLGSVKVNLGQFEQVIVNLVVNAHDAMPKGGKLILETSNVTLNRDCAHQQAGILPGKYVRVTISDTGIGMTEQVKARLFEPFFTTKDEGKGTGLGLATCYGIIKQSGGYILVYSELGQGTTFKIYLPRIEDEVASLPLRDDDGYLPRGYETVLLVEDESLVRGLAVRVLREYGYTVLEAANGDEAMRIFGKYAEDKIHLLLTDVVMPHMGGQELAERVKNLRSETKVLFTSGYTDTVLVHHHGLLSPDIAFLEKPYSPGALLRKTREVLDM